MSKRLDMYLALTDQGIEHSQAVKMVDKRYEGNKMNTVTQEDVDSSIIEIEVRTVDLVGKKHCLVAVKLSNGFTIIETSTCVDPDNYSEEIGADICMKKIKDKIWMLEGYALQTHLKEFGR